MPKNCYVVILESWSSDTAHLQWTHRP